MALVREAFVGRVLEAAGQGLEEAVGVGQGARRAVQARLSPRQYPGELAGRAETAGQGGEGVTGSGHAGLAGRRAGHGLQTRQALVRDLVAPTFFQDDTGGRGAALQSGVGNGPHGTGGRTCADDPRPRRGGGPAGLGCSVMMR
nr:hypothetical protein [Streptomyces sp. CB02923]